MLGYALSQTPISALADADSSGLTLATLYVSNETLITATTDTPAYTEFLPRAAVPFTYDRSILGADKIGGPASTSYGDLVLDNSDGYFDVFATAYAVDGRAVTVKMGPASNPDGPAPYRVALSLFETLLAGTALGSDASETEIQIHLRDNSYLIEIPLQPNLYGGTGGLDGDSNLANKPKPVWYGHRFWVTPTFLGVIGGFYTYQLNDGPMLATDVVRDKGAVLTAGSEYTMNLATGILTLLVTPQGTVTCDGRGDTSPTSKTTGYINRTADIARALLENRLGIDPSRIDDRALDQLNIDFGYEIGWGADQPLTGTDAMTQLADGMGGVGWHGWSRVGKFQMGMVKPASGVPVTSFDASTIKPPVERLPLPSQIIPAAWRIRVGYAKCNTVSTTDLAAGISDSDRAFAKDEYRTALAENSLIKLRHPQASDPEQVASWLVNQSEAAAHASYLLSLWGQERAIYRWTDKSNLFANDITDVVRVTYPRFDLQQGRLGTVLSIHDDGDAKETQIAALF